MAERLVGIDIGGTKIAFVLGDTQGGIEARSRRPTGTSGDVRADVERLADDVRALLDEHGVKTSELRGVGVSVPGPFDPERGMLLRPPNMPGWRDVPLRDWLGDALGTRVALENDANAAALAEWRYGAGRGHEHLVYMTMSTGVGGGLVLGGRIHRGAGFGAGEVGHAPVEPGGEPCGCGLHGCLEAYCGGINWTRRLQRVTPADSEVARLAGGADNARPEEVVEAAREGDAFALAELERFNDYLAQGIVQLAFVLDPSVVILGTICVAAGEELCFAPLREKVRERLWPDFADHLQIVPAELGAELPYRAGLAIAQDAFVERSAAQSHPDS